MLNLWFFLFEVLNALQFDLPSILFLIGLLAFKKIQKDHKYENMYSLKMITKLKNALLNLQQMSSQ